MAEADEMLLAVAPDLELEHGRQRIDHGHADAMQAARHLVGIVILALAELAAGVQLGHDHLGGGNAFLGMQAGGDAATVVVHRARAVGVEGDDYLVGESGQRLVDGIVDDLVDHVVQAGPIIGVADVHAGPLADSIQPFQDLDLLGAVILCASSFPRGFRAHVGYVPGGCFLLPCKIHQRRAESTSKGTPISPKTMFIFNSLWRLSGSRSGFSPGG